jgi:carboxyl-terminal processing protease
MDPHDFQHRIANLHHVKLNSRRLVAALIVVLLGANLLLGYDAYAKAANRTPGDSGYGPIGLFMQVVQVIRQNYVDEDRVGYETLIRGALKGMMHELDPFSAYMEPKNYSDMVDDTEGREFGGVGIHITVRNGVLTVIAPMEDTPAFKADIKPGDVILEIEGSSTRTMSLDECVGLLQGEPGTSLRFVIYRESEDLTREITLERAKIEVHTVKSAMIPDTRIGYVRISQFNAPTAEDLDTALAKLDNAGAQSLVLDLRDNPGGLLQSAVDVCSRFLPAGQLIVFTEGRNPESRQEFFAGSANKHLDPRIAILVNGNSASAAEIVAGCLQDQNRAVLVGETTFGKGSVQTVMPLPDRGALRLTTAHYYTPSKRVIHERGIDPDIAVPLPQRDALELVTQRVAYPGIVKPTTKDAVRDTQLERAVEILKGIMLFSGTKADAADEADGS